MGNFATVVKLSAALLFCLMDSVWSQAEFQGCVEDPGGCKRCRGDTCARCAVLLHKGTCVDSCPPGHTADWSTRDEYMGKVCKETGYIFGLTGSQVAILVGVVSGATICVFIVLCGAIIVHRKKKKATKIVRQFENSAERGEFLRHLATLRGEGHTFLSMLNDTRRQVRELYYSGNNGDGAVGIQAYRPVLRDLARILVLVNKKDEDIQLPPDDWQRLLSWAERLLRRYKRHSSPEVAQLVTFLQHPPSSVQTNPTESVVITPPSQPFEPRSTPTNLTTFQANLPLATFQASDKSSISPASSSLGYAKDSPLGSSLGQNSSMPYHDKLGRNNESTMGQMTPLVFGMQKKLKSNGSHFQELAISVFNNHNGGATLPDINRGSNPRETSVLDREINPQWEFQSAVEAANYTILSDRLPDCDYLIDDFTILGFRPQDEITTEL
ncbi:uncharacterized protein LOC122516484 [Polistes fuscatus]|uniref:uncharacterized protein LOC122516484 n=1 Tax=Polistes fuscatus TaxID=30207 RepID=UPI001CAA2838|nr:uncharacterized protein LOC122516484 [Polistes fuscatus]